VRPLLDNSVHCQTTAKEISVSATTKDVCMTTRKLKCSTRCSLGGTRIISLRRFLVDCRPVSKKGSVRKSEQRVRIEASYGLGIRAGLRGIDLTVKEGLVYGIVQWRRQTLRTDSITQEKELKNPGAGLQAREDKVSSLCCVTPQGESLNKSSYQIRNLLITVALPRKHVTIYILLLQKLCGSMT
jgi:hypothetical protein